MSEKDINRWHETITPRSKSPQPWTLGSGGSWDMTEVQPIPDDMLADLARRYYSGGAPWNCRSMPLSPSDREFMFLLHYSMQGLVARMRLAEKDAADLRAQLEAKPAAPAAATLLRPWPNDLPFRALKGGEIGDHSPWYIVCPGGEVLEMNHNAYDAVDEARAKWMVSVLNLANTRAAAPAAEGASDPSLWPCGDCGKSVKEACSNRPCGYRAMQQQANSATKEGASDE